jgi:DNA-directed RNA polymerase subunit RPC12/RpoP
MLIGLAALLVVAPLLFVVRRFAIGRRLAAPADQPAAIEFFCANCGTRLKIQAALAGAKVKCPKCATVALVPGAAPKAENPS